MNASTSGLFAGDPYVVSLSRPVMTQRLTPRASRPATISDSGWGLRWSKPMTAQVALNMGVSTVLIGAVPTYQQIGIWAPITLLLLRIFQGIGLGGEWGGAVLMTFEFAKPSKRGFYASLPQIGLSLGLCLSSGVVGLLSYTLTDAQFLAWGWRVAFFLSIVLLFVGTWIRLHVMETPEFQKAKKSTPAPRIPLVEMWKNHKGNVLAGMCSPDLLLPAAQQDRLRMAAQRQGGQRRQQRPQTEEQESRSPPGRLGRVGRAVGALQHPAKENRRENGHGWGYQ